MTNKFCNESFLTRYSDLNDLIIIDVIYNNRRLATGIRSEFNEV